MEPSNDPCLMSARDQLRLLRDGSISAAELLDAQVDRVGRLNPAVNLVVTTDLDRASAAAAASDRRRAAGEPLGPLDGLSLTVKDSLMTEGCLTTSGAIELAGFVPDHDADPVAALRSAGAGVFAKTNLPLYAGDVQTYNHVFGVSNNPWDLARSVGGSSGGSAGSVAVGFSPLEVGSDIAGSIRNPAAMCGVVGHKPSYGIVSARGQIPGPPGTLTQADLAVVGPLARTVADCELALGVLAGPDAWYSPAWRLELPEPRTRTVCGLRVAVMGSDPACPVDPEIEAAIRGVAEALEAQGAVVSFEARPDSFDFGKAERTFTYLLGGALSGTWPLEEIERMAARRANGEAPAGELGVHGAAIRHREWLSHNERRLQMRARWDEFFRDWDVVLAPVSPTVAIPHDHSEPQSARTILVAGEQRSYLDQLSWMGLFGLAYLPSTSMPVAIHSTGLPIGMQVVAPFLEDRTGLAVAGLIEALVDTRFVPPMALT